KPVTRVDRVGAAGARGVEDRGNVEVTLRYGRGTDAAREVGGANVRRRGVRVGVHGDRLDPHLAARADDSQRDFAAIRYEEPSDRHEGSRFSMNARMPSWPSLDTRRS